MKLQHLLTSAVALSILLAGCGSQEKSDNETKHEEKSKKEDNQKTEKQESKSSSTNKNQSNKNSEPKKESKSNVKPLSQLTPQEKVALALYAPKSAEFTVTPSELLNHSYVYKGNGGSQQRAIQQLSLSKASPNMIPEAPSNMRFYSTPYDSRGSFTLVIGISDTQVLVSGTQGINPYQDLVNFGKLYDVKELYNRYKDRDFQQVANLISISESPEPISKEDSNSSNDNHSSDSGEKVTRANVIDKVEEYEGHQLDTSTYTYKEPEQKSDGSWGFSFVDKSGHLAGSYVVNTDGFVEKFDSKGQLE